jgi:hypothetical protein
VSEFNKTIKAVKPDFLVSMYYELSWSHTRKRMKKLIDMSLTWLDESLKLNPEFRVCYRV